jgi:hypothetical protein
LKAALFFCAGENASERLEETQIQLLESQAAQESLKMEIADYKQQVGDCWHACVHHWSFISF